MKAAAEPEGLRLGGGTGSGWSVVITGFPKYGNRDQFREAVKVAVARSGLDVFSITRREHLPAELVGNLNRDEAKRIAELLRTSEATIDLRPTENIGFVRHRADEVWPSRTASGFHFAEIEGCILTLPPLNARENLGHMQRKEPTVPLVEFEPFLNHTHPANDSDPPRAMLRTITTYIERLEAALREAYPERSFVIVNTYLDNNVTFYRRGEGLPDELPRREQREVADHVYCEHCSKEQLFWPARQSPDPEFPEVEWGECNECCQEVVVRWPWVFARGRAGDKMKASEASRHGEAI